jgi:hypothetical protein
MRAEPAPDNPFGSELQSMEISPTRTMPGITVGSEHDLVVKMTTDTADHLAPRSHLLFNANDLGGRCSAPRDASHRSFRARQCEFVRRSGVFLADGA